MKYYFALSAVFLFLMSSCVASRKYEALEADQSRLRSELRDTSSALRNNRVLLSNESRRAAELEEQRQKLKRSLDELQANYDQTLRLKRDIEESYNRLLELNKQMTNKANADAQALTEQQTQLRLELERRERQATEMDAQLKVRQKQMDDLQREFEAREKRIAALQGDKTGLEKDLAEREKRMQELERTLADREGKVKTLEANLSDREKRVKELESLLAAQKQKVTELRDRIRQALRGFEGNNDISVEEKDGKVYVSLSQKLLFATGSKTIDRKGKEALAKLSEILVKNTDMAITVEGHTDSDGDDLPNWDLSVGRATAIIAELLKSGVDPKHVTAAGRGEHAPKMPNTSPENKAINRRSEIILSPDLGELYKILED